MKIYTKALLISLVAASLSAAPRKVVLISIDGLKGVTLASLAARHLNTPNLNEMATHGALADGLEGVLPTVTYPSHTTLVTGVKPASHGILGNGLFDPEHKLGGAWYYYAEQIKCPAIWDLARQAGLKTASVSWPVTVGAAIDADIPEFRPLRTYEETMLLRSISTPGLLTEYEKAEGALPVGEVDDQVRAKMASFLIGTRKPDLLLVHLIDLDHQEHLHGPESQEALATLEQIDKSVGTIREAVRKAGVESQTEYVIVSDHGFFGVDKSFHPSAVLNGLGLLGTAAHPDQWRVAAFSNGSSFGLVAHDPKDQEAIDLARATFRTLAQNKQWGLEQIFEGDALKKSEGYANSFMAVSLQQNFSVGGGAEGPWVTSSGNTHGMHGYAPGPVELDASFVAFGPGIQAKHLGRHQLVDVAPTVAKLLNLPLKNAEGQNLLDQ